MVDNWANKFSNPIILRISAFVPKNVSANKITIIGFLIGLIAVLLIFFKLYYLALIMILINRFFDGLDGAIARRNGATSFGGYLDITCDLIFYSAVIFGFALADPGKNGLASLFLVFSFVGTGTSFLAFAAISKKHDLFSKDRGYKAFYYARGLVEGTETILFYIIICLFPEYFPLLAVIFGIICWVSVFGRIGSAYFMLR